MPDRIITLKDIAKKADLHFTTVSMALKGDPRIKEATRMRVEMIATQMGYRRDPMLGALARRRWGSKASRFHGSIGFLTAYDDADAWRKLPFILGLYEGAAAQTKEAGWNLDAYWIGENGRDLARVLKILESRGIQGVLVAPTPHVAPEAVQLQKELTAVYFGFSMQAEPAIRVATHHFEDACETVRQCHARGWRRLVLVLDAEQNERTRRRWKAGFLIEGGCRAKVLQPANASALSDEELAKYKPDAIISSGSLLIELMKRHEAGSRAIPLVALNRLHEPPSIPGMNAMAKSQGAVAADVLIARLNRSERGQPEQGREILLCGEWTED